MLYTQVMTRRWRQSNEKIDDDVKMKVVNGDEFQSTRQ